MTDRYGGYCVTYNYDQWGKLLSQSGTTSWAQKMMNLNPLRYREYVYDSDSGLYYLQSRYYDPTTCRFINADDSDVLQSSSELLDTNLFAYCGNNAINKVDSDGYWAQKLSGFGWVRNSKGQIIGFHVKTCKRFLSKIFCIAYAWDIIRLSGWHWSWFRGFSFVGLSVTQLAAEFFTHAALYYFTSITVSWFHRGYNWNMSGKVIDIAANDPREWQFLVVWNASNFYYRL
ncbi:MAG: RHS repeat-associated core domain-containing protein [Bacillota bacterium]|nr:RHS repeat-associated core domain-containing protein [Bacillota bacterium]